MANDLDRYAVHQASLKEGIEASERAAVEELEHLLHTSIAVVPYDDWDYLDHHHDVSMYLRGKHVAGLSFHRQKMA